MKYSFDLDMRHAFLGVVLLICLSVLTILASVGLSEMEKQKVEGINFDYMWTFMQTWSILGMLILPVYITFFTRFNNPFKKKEDSKP